MLSWLGVPFRVVAPRSVDETPLGGEDPGDLAIRLARLKARDVSSRCPRNWVLAADTVVDRGGRILGKPIDRREGEMILRDLSGKRHRVRTGVVLVGPGGKWAASRLETTWVTFRGIRRGERSRYLRMREAYDKAGGYAIQGKGLGWVVGLEGDFFNVVGLPLGWVAGRLARIRGLRAR
jgi:septum formation protein